MRGPATATVRWRLTESIESILAGRPASAPTIAEKTGASAATIRALLGRLEQRGHAIRVNHSRGGPGAITVWALDPLRRERYISQPLVAQKPPGR
jgi:DNA-binding IclR family transcriptional regulator